MPLSRARDRERKRLAKFQPNSNLTVRPTFQPKSIPGLIMQGNRIVGVKKEEQPVSNLPLYDPQRHKAGDRVLIQSPYSKRMIEMTIPEIDADGNPIT